MLPPTKLVSVTTCPFSNGSRLPQCPPHASLRVSLYKFLPLNNIHVLCLYQIPLLYLCLFLISSLVLLIIIYYIFALIYSFILNRTNILFKMYLIFKILTYNRSCIHASARQCISVSQPVVWDIMFPYYYYYYTLINISLT